MLPTATTRRRSPWLLPWLLLAAAISSAGEPPQPVAPRERPRWTPVAPHAPTDLPAALRPPVTPTPSPETARRAVPRGRHDDRRPVQPPAEDDRLLAYASDAGRWAAQALFEARGRLAVLRVGLRQGLRVAIDDPSLGDWDEAEGRHAGRLDDGARRWGEAVAGEAAAIQSAADAAARIEQLFATLDGWPEPEPPPPAPGFTPAIERPAAPTLEAMFAAWPPDALPASLAPVQHIFRGWDRAPWWLCHDARIDDLLEHHWTDPGRGFELWLADPRRDPTWQHLDSEIARDTFRKAFDSGFRNALDDTVANLVEDAWQQGFAAGWSYGAWVVGEWRFAAGYAEGWQWAAADAAAREFPHAWEQAWQASFAAAYQQWRTSTVPRLRDIVVRDANDDGVFEPGEMVLIEVEAANLGGRAGRSWLEIDGPVLEAPFATAIELPARRASQTPLEARLSRDAPNHRRAVLEVRLGEDVRSHPLWISHPLELRGGVRAPLIDPVAGRTTVAATIVNTSRLPVAAQVGFEVADAPELDGFADLGVIAPAADAEASFELAGIHGLDLLAGSIHGTVVVRADGVEQDRAATVMPRLATDLGSSELERYLAAMAGRAGVPADETGLARTLILWRLQADWEAAVATDGNPYRDDLRGEGRRTALGDLVRLTDRVGPGAASPQVFAGLRRDALDLAAELPGSHPLLRKWYRRLASRLPE